MNNATKFLRKKISQIWIQNFWQYPHRLRALKVSVSVSLLIIPFEILNTPFIGTTLALGAIAGALSETDDHPKGRIKTLLIGLISFFISCISVELLRPYPLLFGIGLVLSTFSFILLGGMGERYRGITFGALLIAIYTMLGTYLGHSWYFHPSLLCLGALCYGIVSLALLYARPWRLLKEQLALAYRRLADYTAYKAKFFPSPTKDQEALRNQLAQKNIAVVQSLRQCENAIKSYAHEVKDHPTLAIYYEKWLHLQQMHERAISSHERYDLLSNDTDNPQLIEGFGQLLLQIAEALNKLSNSMLSGKPYKHPSSLSWLLAALHEMLDKNENDSQHSALSLLFKNLAELEYMLASIDNHTGRVHIPRSIHQAPAIKQRLKKLFKKSNPRFRHAIRLSICFAAGYAITYFFNIEKGDWILLTSFLVCQQTYSETRQRLIERIIGTIIGVIAGIFIAQLLPTPSGQVLLLVGSTYCFFIWLFRKYTVAVVFITTFVLASFSIQSGAGTAILIPRLIDTLIGAALAFLVVRFIWPDWQYKRLPQLLNNAFTNNIDYLQAIINSSATSQDYLNARQAAHEADSALTLAWRGIKVEPKKSSFFEKNAFKLTFLNHAFLSYLSALGAHKHKKELSTDELAICTKAARLLCHARTLLAKTEYEEEIIAFITQVKDWQRELRKRKENETNERMLLLYNIVRTAKELIEQALQKQS